MHRHKFRSNLKGSCVTCQNAKLIKLLKDLLIKLTNCTELGLSGEAIGSSAGQEIPRIVWKTKVHYRVHNSPPPVSILSEITAFHLLPSFCFRSILNTILPSTPVFPKCSFTFVFPHPTHHTQYLSVSHDLYCLHSSTIFTQVINHE